MAQIFLIWLWNCAQRQKVIVCGSARGLHKSLCELLIIGKTWTSDLGHNLRDGRGIVVVRKGVHKFGPNQHLGKVISTDLALTCRKVQNRACLCLWIWSVLWASNEVLQIEVPVLGLFMNSCIIINLGCDLQIKNNHNQCLCSKL